MKKIIAALLITLVLLSSCQQDKNINRYGDSEYDCIVVIGIDGAGTFFGANTPNFDRIFVENGAYTHSARCETPSISAQNWGTYLHGIVPEKHNSTNISIGTQRFPHREYPSIFLLTRKAYPQCEMASFCSWCPINYGLIEKKADVYKDTDLQFLNSLHTDRETTDLVLEYLDTTVPQLMFIHYNETDEEYKNITYDIKGIEEELDKLMKTLTEEGNAPHIIGNPRMAAVFHRSYKTAGEQG